MRTTARTQRSNAAPSSMAAPTRRRTLVGVLTVAAVEAALVTLFLLGWTTAVPAPDAPLAAPTPAPVLDD